MLKALYRQMMLSQGAGRPISFEVARAEELVRAGEHEAARSVLEPYLSSYPLSGHALHVAGLIELSQGSPAAAVEAIKRAVRAEPANPMIRANFALALWRCGALEEARGELEIALRDLPMMFEPSLNLIQIHLALGDPLRAYRVLMHALEHEFEFEPVDAAKLWLAQVALEPFFPGIDGPACIRRAAELDPNVTGKQVESDLSKASLSAHRA